MGELDELLCQPTRLRIMAALMALRPDEKVDFGCLRTTLDLTDGNLGAHLQKIEEAGYIRVEKTFVGRKPRTYLAVTDKGRAAFGDHVAALRRIAESAAGDHPHE
ncbi:MAG: transcriptional regulator [Phycisphaerae bacterium]|nr:transcriptional regulator [Phycisphaerae bacterium]